MSKPTSGDQAFDMTIFIIKTLKSCKLTHAQAQQALRDKTVVEGMLKAVLKGEPVFYEGGNQIALPPGIDPKSALRLLTLLQKGEIPQEILDPFSPYRRFDNGIFIGPDEVEKAFLGSEGENPLGLPERWAPRDIPMVIITPDGREIEITPDLIRGLSELCKTKEWKTLFILYLCPPSVPAKEGNLPTHLINQSLWWRVAHDNLGPGTIRNNVFYSNWFLGPNHQWAQEPASTKWCWRIGYEHPLWTAMRDWDVQQAVVAKKKMDIATVSSDTLMLNLVRALDAKLRMTTWSRTNTPDPDDPLCIYGSDDGVNVNDDWYCRLANDRIGVSVQGVPLELHA